MGKTTTVETVLGRRHSRSLSEGCRLEGSSGEDKLAKSPSSLWISLPSPDSPASKASTGTPKPKPDVSLRKRVAGGLRVALRVSASAPVRMCLGFVLASAALSSRWQAHHPMSMAMGWLTVMTGVLLGLLLHLVFPTNNGHKLHQCANGDIFEGMHVCGKKHGMGCYLHSVSRDVFSGAFAEGDMSLGIFKFATRGRYEGQWKGGRYDGYGVEYWTQGSRYLGRFSGGKREGSGVYKFFSGDVFEGQWKEGRMHGYGVQRCVDGSCYVGEYLAGMKHGAGSYDYANGDRFTGGYYRDQMSGFGVYEYSTGVRFLGEWRDGQRHGWGAYEAAMGGKMRWGRWAKGVEERDGEGMSHREEGLAGEVRERALRAAECARRVRQGVDGRAAEGVRRAFRAAEHWAERARRAAGAAAAANQHLKGALFQPVAVGGE